MLTRHVEPLLSAYRHGELEAAEARRVAEHIIGCERCRAAYESIKLGSRLAARLEPAAAPDDLWDAIEARLDAPAPARSLAWRWYAAAAAVVLAVAGAAFVVLRDGESGPSYAVTALGGAPGVGSSGLGRDGRLGVGEALETDSTSTAEIEVGAIGWVQVEPNSRVRLVEARLTEHRLALDRGTLAARIWAPPRIFFVDTPSAVAVDYGCAYTLTVDDAGASLLHVTSGQVALELDGRASLVPAGAACATRPGRGPGTPFFVDASERLRGALAQFDFESGGSEALETVLAEARTRDSLTLWYLLTRAGDARPAVYDRLAALVPPPRGVTRDRVLALDHTALDRWHEEIELVW
jgi:predicted anti-sigma-YlaC factor YlaD